MKSSITITIFVAVVIFIANAENHVKRIIVDLDAGIDDFHALVFLLNAEHEGLVKIEAIVCANGNARIDDVANNVFRLLEIIQRTDIPVYLGSYNSIIPRARGVEWFGKDGFGDLVYNRKIETQPQKEFGIVAMKNLLKENPQQISIVSTGPLTNIGLLLTMFNNVAEHIKEVIVMGGNYLGEEAEYNFRTDPEAASIVLSKLNVRMLTWQACSNVSTDLEWRFGININNPVWNLLENAERKIYKEDLQSDPKATYFSCDGFVGLLFAQPDIVTGESKHAAYISENITVLVVVDGNKKEGNADIIYSVDSNSFKTNFIKNFEDICKNYKCLYS